MRHVWIDTDMGFDDLWAILALLRAPDIIVDGIGLVAGNAPLPIVADNASRAKAFFGWPQPLHAGCDRPLLQPPLTASYVLGDTGMQSVGRELPPAPLDLERDDAVRALADWLSRLPVPGRILALGPATNLARLAVTRPALLPRIGEIVLMGGSTDRGNHTAAAEFNVAVDPEAMSVVLGAGRPVRMIGLNACRQVQVRLSDVTPLRAAGGERAALLADLLEGYVRIAAPDGSRPMSVYDPLAAAALVDPAAIRWIEARVDVELEGRHTRGMTVVESRVPQKGRANALVAVDVDVERVRPWLLTSLLGQADEDE